MEVNQADALQAVFVEGHNASQQKTRRALVSVRSIRTFERLT